MILNTESTLIAFFSTPTVGGNALMTYVFDIKS